MAHPHLAGQVHTNSTRRTHVLRTSDQTICTGVKHCYSHRYSAGRRQDDYTLCTIPLKCWHTSLASTQGIKSAANAVATKSRTRPVVEAESEYARAPRGNTFECMTNNDSKLHVLPSAHYCSLLGTETAAEWGRHRCKRRECMSKRRATSGQSFRCAGVDDK